MKKIFILVLLIFSQTLFAGSKGFDMVVLNIGDPNFFDSQSYQKFIDNDDRDLCWKNVRIGEANSDIAYLTRHTLPKGLDIALAKKIWDGNPEAIKEARRIINLPGGGGYGQGYDGLYIVKPIGTQVSVMGVGANSNEKRGRTGVSKKFSDIAINEKTPAEFVSAFEKSLCKITRSFNVGVD